MAVTEEVKEGAKDAAPEENAVEPDPEAEKAVEAQKETVISVKESVEAAAVVAPEEPAAVKVEKKEEVEDVKKEAAVEETKEEVEEVKKEAEEETPHVVEAAPTEVTVEKTED